MKTTLITEKMKKTTLLIMALTVLLSLAGTAQESKTSFSAGADLVSSYIWRGSKFGTGPAIQPSVEFKSGGLAIGVWGSFDAAGYTEADPYISYSFSNGLSIGVTDYYYPSLGGSFFADSSNAYEINLGFTTGGLNLAANYILNESPLPASAGSDLYFEAGYAFNKFNLSVGAGDGWHTSDGKFNVCHVALGTSKEISLTDTYSLPLNGQVILNPEKNLLYVVVGITL